MMDSSTGYLRQFAPAVLAAVAFAGGPGTEPLLAAVSVLAELYATGARKVPATAPVEFVPARWAGYLAAAAEGGDVEAYRHYWELCVLVGLRDGLRSGDVFVPGSRRYADPASFLLTAEAWAPQRTEFCTLVGKQLSPRIRDPGEDHAVPDRRERRLRGPVPAVRAAADPPSEHRPDHEHVG